MSLDRDYLDRQYGALYKGQRSELANLPEGKYEAAVAKAFFTAKGEDKFCIVFRITSPLNFEGQEVLYCKKLLTQSEFLRMDIQKLGFPFPTIVALFDNLQDLLEAAAVIEIKKGSSGGSFVNILHKPREKFGEAGEVIPDVEDNFKNVSSDDFPF